MNWRSKKLKQTTNSMETSPAWEATTHSGTQELHHILRNGKVYCSADKSQTQVHILSQMNSVHTTPYSSYKNHLIIVIPPTSRSFQLWISQQHPACSPPPFHAVDVLTHQIIFGLISLITFGEKYKLWSVSLFRFL
jgi:hypothetical protein